MSSLKYCLKKCGLEAHEQAIINGYVADYREEGFDGHMAAVKAVRDYIEELRAERESITKQIEDAIKAREPQVNIEDEINDLSMDEIDKLLDSEEGAPVEEPTPEPPTPGTETPPTTEEGAPFVTGDKVKKGERVRWEDYPGHFAEGVFEGKEKGQYVVSQKADYLNATHHLNPSTLFQVIAPATTTTGGGRTTGGARGTRRKTIDEIISAATTQGVTGIEEAAKGLYDLFGGGSLKSFPGGIDEDTYAKAKPHFQKALDQFKALGKTLKEFVAWAYETFSTKIKPYLRKFIAELKGVTEQPEGGDTTITIEDENEPGISQEEKKRRRRLKDAGEKMSGKRSSKDHRTRSRAIEEELNDPDSEAEAFVKALIKKADRSSILRVDHPVEGRTPGVKRFLEAFRRSHTMTWHDRAGRRFGLYAKNDLKKLVRAVEEGGADMRAKLIESASGYIAAFEQLNEAVSKAMNVAQARHGIMVFLFGEEKANAWADLSKMQQETSSYATFTPSHSETPLTDQGKAFMDFAVRMRGLLINDWLTWQKNENEATKNLPIERTRRNIMDIESPQHYRNGRDVTGDDLIATFGLRGVEFGEWTEADHRQRSVNLTYDSFKMLAEVLGMPDKGISLMELKRLGIGFGSRGRGGHAAAHFEPDNNVINLTKTMGDGSLAHEWSHGFDYMALVENMRGEVTHADGTVEQFNAIEDLKEALRTYYDMAKIEEIALNALRGKWGDARKRTGRLEEAKRFMREDAIRRILTQTRYYQNSKDLDGGKRDYWAKPTEMMARAFESYVADQLQGSNRYLVDEEFVAPGAVETMFNRISGAYPTAEERQRFNQIFKDFFSQLEWIDGVPKLKPGFVPVTVIEKRRAKEAIDQIIEQMDKMFEALYGGGPSEDGRYWYAYEQSGRGHMAQPKGYTAYDDSYTIPTPQQVFEAYRRQLVEKYGDDFSSKMTPEETAEYKKQRENRYDDSSQYAGKGAVGYDSALKAEEALAHFLKPIIYTHGENTIILEVPDGTTSIDVGADGVGGVEGEPTPHGGATGGGGTAGGGVGTGGIQGGGGSNAGGGGGNVGGGGQGTGLPGNNTPTPGGGSTQTPTGPGPDLTGRLDYEIRSTADEPTSQVDRFNANLAAIRVLKQIEGENRLATAEEQAVLAKYSGWGELAEALSDWPSSTWSGRADMVRQVMTDEERASAATSGIDAYYTGAEVAIPFHNILERLGFGGGRMVETSAGIGRLVGSMSRDTYRKSQVTMIEMDNLSSRIARQLYQSASVINSKFEDVATPDNFFDVSWSNVPFGTSTPFDRKHNPNGFRIHDYFINKMINITKPGGLIAVITSPGTMDKIDQRVRESFSKRADFIGGIRLPNRIFPGAESGADMLFFRKKGPGLVAIPKTADWVATVEADLPVASRDGVFQNRTFPMTVNNYFISNPQQVLGDSEVREIGRYGQAQLVVPRPSDFTERLNTAMESFPASIYTTERQPVEMDPLDMIPVPEHVKDFQYFIHTDGKIYQNASGTPVEQTKWKPKQIETAKALIGMRGTIRALLRAQVQNDKKLMDRLRKQLNKEYQAFVKKHGPINKRYNYRHMITDPDIGMLLGLEDWDREGQKVDGLAAIFTKNTVARAIPPTSAETASDGLLLSLQWRGRVDIPYIGRLTGKSQDTVINELQGKIFDDPEKGYVTADEYLSGNVKKKLEVARQAAGADPKYQANVEALEIVQPVPLQLHEIGVKLGAAYIPAGVIRDFVNEIFGQGIAGFNVDHVEAIGLWSGYFRGRTKRQANDNEAYARTHTVATDEFGTQDVNFFGKGGILDYALNGGFPEVWRERTLGDGTKQRYKDLAATDAANAKLANLHARFRSWVAEVESVGKQIEEVYNDRFNTFVERKYDGSHLVFPGKVPDEIIKFRPHQKNGIWRALQSPATYFAHEVGTGKTFTMIGTVMEARRLGLAKKPVMVVKKASLEQITGAFLNAYPGANILVLKVPENKEKRRSVLHRIATGDYDCIILTHQSFEQIQLSPETQREYIQEELDRMRAALAEIQASGAGRFTVREVEKKIRDLTDRLNALMAEAQDDKDPVPSMEEMGIDMIVVDEAHSHKKIGFASKYSNLKGVDSGHSGIARDLFFKTSYIHRRYGRGVVLASGTPLTNSVGELYNISRFLHPQELERLGISNFDAWANTFGLMKSEAEYAPEGGGFKMTSRFSEFVNIPELMAITRQHMDIRRASDLKIKRPDLHGDKPTPVMVPMTDYQRGFQEILKARVRHIRQHGRRAEYLGRPDNILRVINDGSQVAMDPRIYDPDAPDDPGSKVNVMIRKVMGLYGTPVDAKDLSKNDPSDPDYHKPYKEAKHLQVIYSDLGVPGGATRLNVYQDIKDKLVAGGIPANEIAFIHDAGDKPEKRASLFRKANAGQIRVLIGSTDKLGIAVNIQERVSYMHHLDVDWNYANYEQRNGRGWRFGNRIDTIGIFNYGTAKTVDAFVWSTVAFKEKLLQQVMSDDVKIRNVLDISKTSIEASEMEGILADDPLHKEKIELDEEVRRLRNVQADYEGSRRRAKERLARLPLEIKAAEKLVDNNHLHLQIAESLSAIEIGDTLYDLEKDGAKVNEAVAKFLKEQGAGSGFIGRFGKIETVEEKYTEKDAKGNEVEKTRKVKKFLPMNGYIRTFNGQEKFQREQAKIKSDANVVYMIGHDVKYEYDSKGGIKHGLTKVQKGLEANIKENIKKASGFRDEIPRLERLIATPWEKQAELAQKELRLQQVIQELLRQQQAEDQARQHDQGGGTVLFQGGGVNNVDIRLEDSEDDINASMKNLDKASFTSNFKQWFKGSAVEKDGTPTMVYHGTFAPEDFTRFETAPNLNARRREALNATSYLGAHFYENAGAASELANKEGGRVIPAYLKIERPLETTEDKLYAELFRQPLEHPLLEQFKLDLPLDKPMKERRPSQRVKSEADFTMRYESDPDFRRQVNNDLIAQATDEQAREIYADMADSYRAFLTQKRAHDGMVYESDEGGRVWVAFEPNQIKSVFNSHPSNLNQDILASVKKSDSPWYSQMAEQVQAKLTGGKPESIAATLEAWANGGQIKAEELEWSGVLQWLEEQDGKVSKAEVIDYLATQGNIRVQEVFRGGPKSPSKLQNERVHEIIHELEMRGFRLEFDQGMLDNDVFAGFYLPEDRVGPEQGGIGDDAGTIYMVEEGETDEEAQARAEREDREYDEQQRQDWLPEYYLWDELNMDDARVTMRTLLDDGYINAQEHDWITELAETCFPEIDETQTKWDHPDLVMPGGTNYRELVLHMPSGREVYLPIAEKAAAFIGVNLREVTLKKLDDYPGGVPKELRDGFANYMFPNTGKWRDFQGSHWTEPNVIVHVRFDERIDADGKKVLFIQEIQSDWHQKGHKRGYYNKKESFTRNYPTWEEIEALGWKVREMTLEGKPTGDWEHIDPQGRVRRIEYDTDLESAHRGAVRTFYDLEEQRAQAVMAGEKVPDGPFKTAWPLLALKRMVRFAAENGFDRLAWTPGAVQIERNNFSKKVSAIRAHKREDTGNWDLSGERGTQTGRRGGESNFLIGGNIPESKLEDYVGALAEKIIRNEGQKVTLREEKATYYRYVGDQLVLVKPGIKSRYDVYIPNTLKEFFGKASWGKPAFGMTVVGKVGGEGHVWNETSPNFGALTGWEKQEVLRRGNEEGSSIEVPFMEITDAMAEKSVAKGMPLFSVKKMNPVARTYMEALKAAIPDQFVTSDDTQVDPHAGLRPEVKKRVQESEGSPEATFLGRAKMKLAEIWSMSTRHRPFLDPEKFTDVADILRTHQDTPDNSVRRAVQVLSGIASGLKPNQYKIFSLKIIMDDMVRDIESGLLAEKEELPFGFTKDEAYAYLDHLTRAAAGDPVIQAALDRRGKFQSRLTEALVQADILNSAVLKDSRYFHHQVLLYQAKKAAGEQYAGLGLTSYPDVRMAKKGWQFGRHGSVKDYNTSYVESEFEFISQAFTQLETKEVLNRVQELEDITDNLKARAEKDNMDRFQEMVTDEVNASRKPGDPVFTWADIANSDNDPLKPFRVKVAMALGNLGKMAEKGDLRYDAEWQDVVDYLADMRGAQGAAPLAEQSRLFKFLSYLMNANLPGAGWAATFYKAIQDRKKYIREKLGKEFKVPKSYLDSDPALKDYTTWKPAPGKSWFRVFSLPDRIVAQIQAGELVANEDIQKYLRQNLARGKDAEWIIPVSVAKTLDGYDQTFDDHELSKASRMLMNAWKRWILTNPYRVLKYNLNNMSGDLDICFAYKPAIIFKYLPDAIRDLTKEMKEGGENKLSEDLQKELDRAHALGVIDSGWSVQEVTDVARELAFAKHMEALKGEKPNVVKRVWRSFQGFTQYRENLLRLAAFRYFKDAISRGEQVYGASNRAEIDRIGNDERKAAKLARELVGDYGNLTHSGQFIRRHLIPFYAWMEINAPRYVRLMRNMPHEGRRGNARLAATFGANVAWKATKLGFKMASFFVLANLWNMTFFPDEEDEIGEAGRRQLHLILGRNPDGSIRSIRLQGAFSDALSWFGSENAVQDAKDILQGKKTWGEWGKDALLATPTKIINAMRPDVKTTGELIGGRSWYPDPFNPKPIRDKMEYLARTFALDSLYDWLAGIPKRGGGSVGGKLAYDIMSLGLYTSDPGEQAYYEIASRVRKFREQYGKEEPSIIPTDKANALYYYRKALSYGDLTAGEKYLRQYYELGGTGETAMQSIKRAHPLGGLAQKDWNSFYKTLPPGDVHLFNVALDWYKKTYLGEGAAQVRRSAALPRGVTVPAETTGGNKLTVQEAMRMMRENQ